MVLLIVYVRGSPHFYGCDTLSLMQENSFVVLIMKQEWCLGLSQKITCKYYHCRESRRLMYISCVFCHNEYVYYYLVLLMKYFNKNKLWMKDNMTKQRNRYCHGHDKNNTALINLSIKGKKVLHIKDIWIYICYFL